MDDDELDEAVDPVAVVLLAVVLVAVLVAVFERLQADEHFRCQLRLLDLLFDLGHSMATLPTVGNDILFQQKKRQSND